jgi:hypothetical protein
VDSIDQVALHVYHAVFENQESVMIEGERYPVRKTPRLGLRIVEAGKYVFLEQNPEKDSRFGAMARQGRKILWVIEDGDYTAFMMDGEYKGFK